MDRAWNAEAAIDERASVFSDMRSTSWESYVVRAIEVRDDSIDDLATLRTARSDFAALKPPERYEEYHVKRLKALRLSIEVVEALFDMSDFMEAYWDRTNPNFEKEWNPIYERAIAKIDLARKARYEADVELGKVRHK